MILNVESINDSRRSLPPTISRSRNNDRDNRQETIIVTAKGEDPFYIITNKGLQQLYAVGLYLFKLILFSTILHNVFK